MPLNIICIYKHIHIRERGRKGEKTLQNIKSKNKKLSSYRWVVNFFFFFLFLNFLNILNENVPLL